MDTHDAPQINHVYPSNNFYRNALMPFVYVFGSNFPPSPVKFCQFYSVLREQSDLYYMAKSEGVRMS